MDPNPQSPSSVNVDPKATFRKPSNDTASRKYRRRSPVGQSSSSDGSPKNHHSSSPIYSREDSAFVSEHHQRRKDDERELNKDSSHSQIGKTSDSYRHSDHHSSRSSLSHSKRDDYGRRDKHVDGEDRNYQKSSSRSGRESMSGHHSDYTRQESEHGRSKGYMDRYHRDKYDGSGNRSKDKEKDSSSLEHQKYKDKDHSSDRAGSGRRHANTKSGETEREWHTRERDSRDERGDYHRSSGDRRSDRTYSRDEPRGHRHDSTSRRDDGGHYSKEGYKSDPKDEKGKYDDWETKRDKDRNSKVPGERFEDKTVFASDSQESPAKKPKSSSSDKFFDSASNGSKFSMTVADEKQFSTSKESTSAQETDGKSLVGQSHANDSGFANDLDAAKVAAMKAAELVNRNLVGVGYMTTDQKKKLLWGNKKAATTEESAHHWDTALFGDRERQEKFNKLMSLRLPWYLWPLVGCEGRWEYGAKVGHERSQWPSPGREAEGTPAGFREAVHCRTSSKRWTHCWIRSLIITLQSFGSMYRMLYDVLLYFSRFLILVNLQLRHDMTKYGFDILELLIRKAIGRHLIFPFDVTGLHCW